MPRGSAMRVWEWQGGLRVGCLRINRARDPRQEKIEGIGAGCATESMAFGGELCRAWQKL